MDMQVEREIWLDWMRVAACLMVMVVHATEPFYLGGDGSLILTQTDAFWASFFDSFVRACVPLFIIASSYLQFPLHYSSEEFFRRRAVRILVPFVLWTVVYALVWGSPVQNFKDLLLNFNYAAGHLWFVYMLVGVYLLMPLLSPWAERVGRTELRIYLGLWLFTTVIPLLRDWVFGAPPVAVGRGQLECLWRVLLPERFCGLSVVGPVCAQVPGNVVLAQNAGGGPAVFRRRFCPEFRRFPPPGMAFFGRRVPCGRAGRKGRLVGDHLVQRYPGRGPDGYRLGAAVPEDTGFGRFLSPGNVAAFARGIRDVSEPFACAGAHLHLGTWLAGQR